MAATPATILNVDDTAASRYTKSRILRQAGYTVVEADNGADALRLVRELLPQLVVLDVKLPDMSGIDACRQIKSDPATRMVPVVQISATFVTPQDQIVGLEGGAEIYLTEPVEPVELTTAVRVLLRLHSIERGLVQSEARWRSFMDSNIIGVTYYDAVFLAAEVESGTLGPTAWREASDAWERANRTRANDFERWALRWGTAVGSHITPDEAMSHMPAPESRHTMHASPLLAPLTGVVDAYEGRLHLYASDPRTAASLLESSARSCNSLDFPFLNVRTHLWLGMAREKLGDHAAACEAYRFVIDRWGASKVPSVSAREAKRRSLALGCKAAPSYP